MNTPAGTTLDGIHNPSFTYDANGNMLCVLAAGQTCALSSATRFVTYTAFDMTATIAQGTTSSTFNYDPEHNRMFRRDVAGGATTNTVYWNDPVANVVNERIQTGSVYTWKNYIKVGGQLIALRTTVDGAGTFDTKYFVTDHLGSVSVVTDGNSGDSNYGQVITGGRLFYDAWGKMRNNDGSADTTCGNPQAAQSATGSDRTFTAQESMPAYCLLNYNARLYDPALGRFLSADPTTEAVYNLQDLNRYSYVLNNPLSLTDPTGYGGLFSHAGIWADVFAIGLAVILQEVALPFIEEELSLSVASLTAVNAGISGGISGAASTGTLKGALIGAVEADAFNAAGDIVGSGNGASFFSAHTAEVFVAHGVVGGLASWANKEKFSSGFLAAGFASLADIPSLHTGNLGADVAIHAVAGGAGSILGGGKFANGAVTGAFGYLFNSAAHDWGTAGAAFGAATGGVVGGVAATGGEVVCVGVTGGGCALAAPVAPGVIAGGAAVGALGGAGIGGFLGWAAGSVKDWLSGTSNSDVPSMNTLESRRSPTLHCQNVECGAPTGGATYPVCQNCNDRLRNGGPPITLENGQKLRQPVVPGEDADEEKK